MYLPKQNQLVVAQCVSGRSYETLIVWHDLEGNVLRSLRLPGGDSRLVLSPDATMLAHEGRRGDVQLWDLESGKQFALLKVPDNRIYPALFSPDGRLFATTSGNTDVLLWDVGALRLEHALPETLSRRGVTRPAQMLQRLTSRLQQLADVEERVNRLVVELDDDDFQVRDRASKALAKFGVKAASPLNQLATSSPSVEVRRRARQLLARIDKDELEFSVTPAQMRYAIGVLAWLKIPGAREALTELAKLPATTNAGKEARAALEQLRKNGTKR